MNRFRTKKRAKDDLAAGRSSEESEQSSLSFFRKGKKAQQDEAKKEFDLTTALPSDNDFRTSLLMSNLSARFSMLREQDDPHTKIGKASDDSVLYPKRQSRLADFGFGVNNGLSDIAEVESIRGANFLRTTSVASDEAESGNGASVLTRARPTEGNNLFGGRQKIYKIPASSGGGMGGRALYDDDVAMSSFQRWRQAEKERTLGALTGAGTMGPEEVTRSESPPPMGYNRKRETSSTTSSASIMARNSTAATSITSQSTSAVKDGQSNTGILASAMTSAIPERSVTRTRRLYEQGITQDAHEQPGSVLARIETLNRQRNFGSRTPDFSQPDNDRFPPSSRSLLAKGSAPNLRAASPPAPARTIGGLDLGIKVSTEAKPNLGGLPPLSPPVSEAGEQPVLPILPKDVGKATAMGIFQKPSHPYDESQYVQRQLQLQQGRETPTQRHREEASDTTSLRPRHTETKVTEIGARSEMLDNRLPPTPVTDIEVSQSTAAATPAGVGMTVDTQVARPSDKDHPAFRQSALPTPLSMGFKSGAERSFGARSEVTAEDSQQPSPEDSPTLGPAAGLSGLVRQHLRTESVESSLGGGSLDVSGPETRFNLDLNLPSVTSQPVSRLNQWPSSGKDWTRFPYEDSSEAPLAKREEEPQSNRNTIASSGMDRSSTVTEDETDEFASQLADARRRVREKLTSYVESDSSRAASPLLLPTESPNPSAQPANPLGILKPKSSRGSLIDRSRNMATGQSKGLKILGLGPSATSQPAKQSLDEKDVPVLETMREEVLREDVAEASYNMPTADSSVDVNPANDRDEDSTAHPGLKAFRQARRELQRRKELETLARHQASQTSQSPEQAFDQPSDMQAAAPRPDRGPRQRTPSKERGPPPVTYRQPPVGEEHSYSSPGGAMSSGERSRSGSETSGGRASSRPPRLRTNTNTNQPDQLGLPNSGRPMMRSPGLPGTDIKGSPMMPPYPYPNRGAPSPAPSPHLDRSRSATNLALHTGRGGLDPHSGQPSPISPMGLPSPMPYTVGPAGSPVGTPTSFGPRPRQTSSAAQSPALGPASGGIPGFSKRPVDKRDISEPTFVMSTSRVPTTTLPYHHHHQQQQPQYPPAPHQPPPVVPGMGEYGGGPRSRSNSRAATTGPAPPVPPINPRRRRDDSRTRGGAAPSAGPYEDGGVPPRLPFATSQGNSLDHDDGRNGGGFFHASEDESARPDQRRRLRKAHPDMQQQQQQQRAAYPGRGRDNSPPFVAKGPPPPATGGRGVAAGANGGGGMGMPGGMI